MIPSRVEYRFRGRIVAGPNECHVCTYSTQGSGYCQVQWVEDGEQVNMLAHRVAWWIWRGPIPNGMTVDHVCRNKRCVNPNHLRLLSNVENARRNHQDYPEGWACKYGHTCERVVWGGQLRCPDCDKARKRGPSRRKSPAI